jgi:hypothetical protein
MKIRNNFQNPRFMKLPPTAGSLLVWAQRIIASAAILLLIAVSMINQPYYPTTWQDEGFTLQGAINLVQNGQYAMRSSEGFRIFDQPLLANGPGVVLPISVAFVFFGIGLLQARVVMAIFLISTAILWYFLAKRMFGSVSAFISVLLLIAIPQEGFLLLGRQALGMIPSFEYFIIGFLLWLSSLESTRVSFRIAAGIFFALAMITKGQYLFLFPMFILVAIIDKFFIHSGAYKNILYVLLSALFGVACWYGLQIVILGWDKFLQNLAALSASAKVTISAFRMVRIPGNLFYLVSSGILLVILPGWFYALWTVRRLEKDSIGKLFLIVFIPFWLLWYAFVSVGWHRYAFDPYAIGTIFTGKLFVDAFGYMRKGLPHIEQGYGVMLKKWLIIAYLLVLIFFGGWGIMNQFQSIFASPNTSPQDFARVLLRTVDSKSIIESWEWEIDALTPNLNFHHPTNDWVDKMTAVLQFGDQIAINYNFVSFHPEYLIDGPFSKWTGLYATALNENCCTLVNSQGPYDLYKVRK